MFFYSKFVVRHFSTSSNKTNCTAEYKHSGLKKLKIILSYQGAFNNYVDQILPIFTPSLAWTMGDFLGDMYHTYLQPQLEEKKVQAFWLLPKFFLILGLLKSRISEKVNQSLLNKLDFKLFHYKARVQPVSKITTIATRNGCWM